MTRMPRIKEEGKIYSKIIFIPLLVVFMGITACGIPVDGGRRLAPSVYYTLEKNNGWRIHQHAKGEWAFMPNFPNLKNDFSIRDLSLIDNKNTGNMFLAEYSDADSRMVVFVATGGFEPMQGVRRDFFGNIVDEYLYDNPSLCKGLDIQRITVAFNPEDMMFDSGSIKFEVRGRIIHGDEIATPFNGKLSEAKKYSPQTYNLTTLRYTIRFEPILGGGTANRDFNHPTFSYRFNLTCRDIENSVFIIDGLSSNGKTIPPLEVRIRYYDFSKVPAYEGESIPKIEQVER